MAQMPADELKAIVDAEIRQSLGYQSDELASDREDAWKGYLAEPYGNEIEGRSSVVSSDIMDTIEWIMPSLMRIFTAGDSAVEFNPTGPEDEEQAKQATDYANYVWDRDNDGFITFYTWFKDSLIAKLGAIKIYWEQKEVWKRETYSDLDDNAYGMIAGDPEMEIIEHTEKPLEDTYSQVLAAQGQPVPPQFVHDVTVKYKEDSGKICVDPMPPDELLFSRDAKHIQTARFVAHRTRVTVSDLIEEYPDKKSEIEDMSSDAPASAFSEQSQFRSTVGEDSEAGDITSALNKAMREVWKAECYIKVDYNGDGIAEMRKITVAGGKNLILDNEDWDGPRPFATLCPILMPHRIVGISVADTIKDLQQIHTTLLRQYLDSLYIANHPRFEVNMDRTPFPDDVMSDKIGGFVRRSGDTPVINPIPVVFSGDTALAGMEYVDRLKENRTGVSQRTQGLGADTLHDTARGNEIMLTAAQSRIELIARLFAETGVKDAFKLILWLSSRYQDKERTVRLRNQWVPMDPRQWSNEYDMTANVGLGHGDNTQKLIALQSIIGMQTKAIELQGGISGPLVTGDNVFNSTTDFAKAAQFQAPERFFTDPKTVPPQPPKPDPEMMKVQAEMQMKQMELQGKAQIDQQNAQMDYALKTKEMQQKAEIEVIQAQSDIATKEAELQMKREEHQMKMQLELAKHQMTMQSEQLRLQADREKSQVDMQNTRTKAKLDQRSKVQDMRMKRRQEASKAKKDG